MLSGLIKGATTAAAMAAIVLSAASLLAPTSREAPTLREAPTSRETSRAADVPRNVAPTPPEMAAAERSAPARPEALPERAAPSQPGTAALPAPVEAPPAAPVLGLGDTETVVMRPRETETVVMRPPEAEPSPTVETEEGPAETKARPERTVTLAIPAGSQFNRPREDFQPVAPDAEDAARGFAAAPTSRPAGSAPFAAPSPDTSSVDAPAAGLSVPGVAVPETGEAPALPAAVEDAAPRTVLDARPRGEGPAAPASGVSTETARPFTPEPVEATVEPQDAPAPVTEASAAPEEPAPVVLEQLSAPILAPVPSGLAPVLALPPVAEPSSRPTATELPPRILPRRVVLDSARPDTAQEAPATRADQTRALTAHAAAFENPEAKPLFSIVLIDDPDGGLSRSSLMGLGLPLTFAIDPDRPDAARAAEAYRAAGHEVLLLAEALPADAGAEQIQAALRQARGSVPTAVGVLDGRDGEFARDRRALLALAEPLAEAGMGFVGFDKGLAGGLSLAEDAGVPTVPVYRVVDGNGERATLITRYLDRATFEAEETGSTIVVGRTQPAMMTALLSWKTGRRAGAVALAPISQVLRAGEEGA